MFHGSSIRRVCEYKVYSIQQILKKKNYEIQRIFIRSGIWFVRIQFMRERLELSVHNWFREHDNRNERNNQGDELEKSKRQVRKQRCI